MPLTPEQQARKNIDDMLRLAKEIIENLETGLESLNNSYEITS